MLSPAVVLWHHSWHLFTRCREGHAWPCSQDRTPLFLMLQQIPLCLLCTCLSQGPISPAERRWTVNTKLQRVVLTPSSPQAQENSGSWRSWTHTTTTPKPAPFPSPVCYGSFWTMPRWLLLPPWCTSWLAKQRQGSISSPNTTAATAAASTLPSAASACHGGVGYGSKGSAWGLDYHPMDSSNTSLWHPQQPTPRRSQSECNLLM